jgi:aminoglycoside phosphotransferase (APT) family kinase protein
MGLMDMDTDWEGMSLQPLEGGFSGETFLGPGDDPYVVRIYRRDPDRAPIDAALLRLVRDILPVPNVEEVRFATVDTPAVLVTLRLTRGHPLDVLLDETDEADIDWRRLGTSLGRALATLSGVPFLRSGAFADPDLAAAPGSLSDDLREWAEQHRDTGRLSTWATADWNGLLEVVDDAEETMWSDGELPRPVLVHSDFNTKNLLVDPDTWEITGVLDWEFAHAGNPYADFGNLTRFERERDFVTALGEAFEHYTPARLEAPFWRGRAADLWAQIELAGRPESNTVTRLAEQLLLAQARTGDLDAWPFEGSRLSVRASRTAGQTGRIGSERGKPVF